MELKKSLLYIAAMLTAATFTGCKDDIEPETPESGVSGLYINEVCSGGTDWVELYNSTGSEIDLSGFHLQDSKGTDEEYTFSDGEKIAAKGFLVLEEGTFTFGISGNGDQIVICDADYAIVDKINVPAMEDGFTYARTTDGGDSWTTVEGGTKGRSNTGTPDENVPETPETPGESDSPVLINEVQGATAEGETDFIELYNPSDSEVDISGYRLQDDKGAEEEYVIPEGTTLAAGAITVFYKDESFTFGLSGSGDKVVVLDAEGNEVDTVEYPEMEDGSSYARTSDGAATWEICTAPTPGESNSASGTPEEPATDYSALKLNELNGNDKFIELYNGGDSDLDISGVFFTKDDEDTFTAPAGTTVPAKGFLTVWSEKADGDHSLIFEFGLSADKSVKVELFDPEGNSIDIFKNLSAGKGESWGEDDGKYDSKDLGSFARESDGAGDWYIMSETEGESNASAEKLSDEKIEW